MKTLTAYFSASGITRKTAEIIADTCKSDLFEIRPKQLYTRNDLNYLNPLSRCNREKIRGLDVEIRDSVDDMESYKRLVIGFPIWYAGAPNIIVSFLKQYDLSGKQIAFFATSGGTKFGKTAEKLKPYLQSAQIIACELVESDEQAKAFAAKLD